MYIFIQGFTLILHRNTSASRSKTLDLQELNFERLINIHQKCVNNVKCTVLAVIDKIALKIFLFFMYTCTQVEQLYQESTVFHFNRKVVVRCIAVLI